MLERTGVEAVAEGTDRFFNELSKMGRSVGDFRGQVNEVPSSIDRMNAAIGKLTFTGVVAGTAAFVALGVAAVAAGFKISQSLADMTMEAARVEEMGVVLQLLGERAGWSADEIDKQTEAIKNLGIRTDVAQNLLAQFARYQLGAADASAIARVAQDAAVLAMKDSSETLDGLLHGILTQNSLVLKTYGINLDVSASYETYAKSIGKAVSQLTEQEKIQAVINGVIAEGEKIAGVYTKAMEEPGKRMRSLSRFFYEARIAIGKFFLPVFGKVIDFIKKFANGIQASLEEGKPLNVFFSKLSEYAGGLFEFLDPLGRLIELLFEGKAISFQFMRTLRDLFGDELAGQIYQFVRLIDQVLQALSTGDWSAVRDMLPQWVVDLWDNLVNAWTNIQAAWEDNLQPALEKLGKWWDENSGNIIAAASGIAGSLLEIASQAVLDGMKLLSEYVEKFVGWLTEHKDDITATLDKVQEFIDEHGDVIKDWFLTMAAISLANLVLDLAGMATNLALVAAPYLAIAGIAAALATIYDIGEKLAKREMTDEDWEKLAPSEQATASIAAAWEEIKRAIGGTAESELGKELNDTGHELGHSWAQGLIDGIYSTFGDKLGSDIMNALQVAFAVSMEEGDWSHLGEIFWLQLSSNVWTQAGENLDKLAGDFTDIFNWILETAGERIKSGDMLRDIGKMIFDALLGGEDVLQGLSDAMESSGLVESLSNNLTNTLQEVKDEVSSTLKGWVDIGTAIIDGIIEGIKQKIADLVKAVTDALSSIPEVARVLLGISSPSKLFQKFGENLMSGMEKGIKQSAYRPARAVEAAVGVISPEKNYYNERTTNVLAGAQITNTTGFDLEAFAETVRNV